MSYTLPPIALTQNQTSPVALPGFLGSVSWVKMVNASPYLLTINNLLGGQDYMQPGEANVWQVPGLTTPILVTPSLYGISPNVIPSSVLLVTWYLEGEQPSGNYPVNFSALSYLGNNVQANSATNTLEQDLLTPFVYGASSFVATKDGTFANQLDVTSGIAFLRQSDGSLLRTAPAAKVFVTSLTGTTYYLDLQSDGSWSWATSHSTQSNYLSIAQVVTDGVGNINTVTDVRVLSTIMLSAMPNNPNSPGLILYNLHVEKNIQVDNQVSVQGSIDATSPATGNGYSLYISNHDGLFFMPTGSTQLQGILFYAMVSAGPPAVSLPLLSIGSTFPGAPVYIDVNGLLHATAPLTLAPGYQETGAAGVTANANGANQPWGGGVNFKTVCTNTPTSITLTSSAINNVASTQVDAINRYGFYWLAKAAAAGLMQWYGTYTTVGNCLLAVDSTARTFDHHCDNPTCGHISRAQPVSDVIALKTEVGAAMSYTCPNCGTSEHFNCALTAADEADPTPQGSGEYVTTRGAQASLIRQLMTALGLEVIA